MFLYLYTVDTPFWDVVYPNGQSIHESTLSLLLKDPVGHGSHSLLGISR